MKKITNSIRIGMVPRKDISSKLNEQHSPSNSQESTSNPPIKNQVNAQNGNGIFNLDPFHDHAHMPRFTSPTHIRVQDASDMNSNKQPAPMSELKSNPSLPTTRPRQETMSELHEVPSKTNTFTTKKVLLGVATAVVVVSMIVVGVVLGVVLSRQTGTTTASPTTSTPAPIVISALWSFDGTSIDNSGVYNGTINNEGRYSTAGSTSAPYFGNTQSLVLNGSSQFVSVPSPFLPLNFTSFTIEAWIHATSLSSDRGIFGQCQCRGCTNQCLYFICRGSRLHIGFTSNDLTGSTILAVTTWYHVAFVYNYQTQQQILYVNGVQDAIRSNVSPYQGTNGSVLIGSAQIFTNTYFFNGHIDNLEVTTRAKSATEILRDASLIVYYSFDWPSPSADGGPNGINGTLSGAVITTGRINQGIRLTGGGTSWFRVSGLYQMTNAVFTNRPFSISLWINPTTATSCTFVQVFSVLGSPCDNLLGFYAASTTFMQLFVQSVNNAPAVMYGPFLTQNVWAHITLAYNTSSGYILFYNGAYFGATGPTTYSAGGAFANLFIGFNTNCPATGQNAACQGSIDELYIHNRDLTQAEVNALANP